MPYVDPFHEVRVWTMATLKAAAIVTNIVGMRIYNDGNVPDETDYPIIVLSDQGASTFLTGVGANLVWDDILLLVKGIYDEMDSETLAPITAGVRQTLHKKRGTTSVARIISCVIEQPFRLIEETDGEFQFLHHGTIFRYKIQPLG